jgi:hypothetical protein
MGEERSLRVECKPEVLVVESKIIRSTHIGVIGLTGPNRTKHLNKACLLPFKFLLAFSWQLYRVSKKRKKPGEVDGYTQNFKLQF